MIVKDRVSFSGHARSRMKQRNVSEREVRTIIRRGQKTVHWRAGERRFRVQLSEADVEAAREPDLLDLIVVLSSDERFVITVLREGEVDEFASASCTRESLTLSVMELIGKEVFAQLSQIFGNQRGKWA